MVFAVANQVSASEHLERLAQHRPIVRVVVTQKGLVQAPALVAPHDIDRFTGVADFSQRIFVAVVHGRGGSHRAGVEGLHLIGPNPFFFSQSARFIMSESAVPG